MATCKECGARILSGGALGLCARHYKRQARTGSLKDPTKGLPHADSAGVSFRCPRALKDDVEHIAADLGLDASEVWRKAAISYIYKLRE